MAPPTQPDALPGPLDLEHPVRRAPHPGAVAVGGEPRAHGARFSADGHVIQGPARTDLRIRSRRPAADRSPGVG